MSKRQSSEQEYPEFSDDSESKRRKLKRQVKHLSAIRNQIAQPSVLLGKSFESTFGPGIFDPSAKSKFKGLSWLQHLSEDDFVKLFNFGQLAEISEDEDDGEIAFMRKMRHDEALEPIFETVFLLDFAELARFAALNTFTYLLFNHKSFDMWSKLMRDRAPVSERGNPMKLKFAFESQLNDWRMSNYPTLKLNAFSAFLNLGGLASCRKCKMHCDAQCESTCGKNDMIPLSVFCLDEESPADRAPTDMALEFSDTLPQWGRNATYMLSKVSERYFCISCKGVLDWEVCGIPLACVFSACAKANGKSHIFTELDIDLVHPETKCCITESLEYCRRCGLLRKRVEKKDYACLRCKVESLKQCNCKPCSLCQLNRAKCKCARCKLCNLCTEFCNSCVRRKRTCTCQSSESESSESSNSSLTFSSSSE